MRTQPHFNPISSARRMLNPLGKQIELDDFRFGEWGGFPQPP